MFYYHIWVDLASGVKDLEFVAAVDAWLGYFKQKDLIEGYKLQRRTFGFDATGLGEFHIEIVFRSMADMETALMDAARRTPDVENLHSAVYSRVINYKSSFFRDFPDLVRDKSQA